MKFLKELKDGETVLDHYFCKQKQQLVSKTGKNYLSLKIQDKTATLDGKVWDINGNIGDFADNTFIKIEAVAQLYNGEIQLNIKKLRRSQEGEYSPYDYVPSTGKDVNDLHARLLGYIESIKDPYIKQLTENIVVHDKTISGEVLRHSAAKNFHHSYMGGLLEHTLAVTDLCDFLAPRYKNVNRDMLICGAILHDICKVYELSDFPENEYTDDGQLLGHIYMCAERVDRESKNISGFPPKLAVLIKHMILSHHGEYEFGSPKRPKLIEACILNIADNADAKMNIFESYIGQGATKGEWIGYNKFLLRNVRTSEY